MKTELTCGQMESLKYRKKRLLDKTRLLELLLSGRSASILPAVRTETGALSEEGVWRLVDQLLDALGKYKMYLRWDPEEQDRETPLSSISNEMPEREKAFYRSFLYCAVRFSESNPWPLWDDWTFYPGNIPWWASGTKGIFDDILSLAEDVLYTSKVELHFTELYQPEYLLGFFAWMDRLYQAFTGKPITDTLSEAERLAVRKQFSARVEEAERLREEQLDEQEANAILADVCQEEYEAMSDEERRQADEEARQYLREEQERNAWIQAFPNKESFCEQYLVFRELVFEVNDWELSSTVEQAIDIYLYERDASSFLDDDVFFSAYALLTKVLGQVQQLVDAEDAP